MKIFTTITAWTSCVLFIPLLFGACEGLPSFRAIDSPGLQPQTSHSENTHNVYHMYMEALPDEESENAVQEYAEGQLHAYQKLTNSAKHKTNVREVTCVICKGIIGLIQTLLAQAKTKADIAKEVTKYCINFKVEDVKVCKGIVKMFQDEVLTVLVQAAISADAICGRIFGNACGRSANSTWNVTFPDTPKPPVVEPKLPKAGSPVLKILQLSDFHIDFEYQPGSETNCGEPLCCRKDNGPSKNDTGAGHWGDYRGCDLPTWTFENSLEHIATTHEDINLIYWTGDLPGHNVWNQSRTIQLTYLKYLTKKLIQYFPNATVLPSIGNHESSPVNSFPPPFVKGNNSISWLYEPMAIYWSLWLPAETMPTIRIGGYYTFLLRPGIRIVSLNMNYCNNQNWWLLLNSTDPAGQLQWLIKVLQQAEDSKEKVHILGHIPPGSPDCTPQWSANFHKVVNRYESTITGMFFGHTHTDSFEVFYDEKTKKRPIQVAYMSPSLTTFSGLNPSYRLYYVDGLYDNSSFYPLHHETYIFNLTLANLEGQPTWFQEYSTRDDYNMTSLFPRDWDNLLDRFEANMKLFHLYYIYKTKLTKDPSECDDDCRYGNLCELRTSNSADPWCKSTAGYSYLNFYLQTKYC